MGYHSGFLEFGELFFFSWAGTFASGERVFRGPMMEKERCAPRFGIRIVVFPLISQMMAIVVVGLEVVLIVGDLGQN